MKEKAIQGIQKLAEVEKMVRAQKEQPIKESADSPAVTTVFRQGNPVVIFNHGVDFRNGGSIPF